MRVYFVASVIIAALLSPTGGSSLLIEYVKKGRITGITSQTVIAEVLDDEVRKKIKRSKEEIEQFITQSKLMVREHITAEETAPYKNKIDIEDSHLNAGATSTKCSFLVSLDKKHILNENIRKIFLSLRIVSPKELLEEIVG